ncbi:hypothetical protein Tco_1475880 [Tanacetum coccineum]
MWVCTIRRMLIMHILLWEGLSFQIENKNSKKGECEYYPRIPPIFSRHLSWIKTLHSSKKQGQLPMARDTQCSQKSLSSQRMKTLSSNEAILPTEPPTVPKRKERKKSRKGSKRLQDWRLSSEADLTEAEQLKIITKRSRQETHSSHDSGSGADEGTGVTPGVPDAPNYDSEDDISWKSSDDDQDDEQAQDDEDAGKNDVNETTQDDEDDDDHDDDEKVQDDDEHDVDETVQEDDDEEQTESDDDGDDFVHPKLTTHDDDIIHEEETDEDDSFDPTIHTPSRISSSDDEDSDNEVEGTNVEGAKSDEEATYEEDQGNEAVNDTNTDLDRRDDVMTDVILPQVQATQEIEDTHVTLTPVNPDGQQQSSSVSSGFVSNMLNSN